MKSKHEVKNQREAVRGAGATLRGAAACLLAVQLGCFPVLAGGTDAERPVAKTTDPVLITMETELNRAKTDLAKSARAEPVERNDIGNAAARWKCRSNVESAVGNDR
jgi:hypothetical protein